MSDFTLSRLARVRYRPTKTAEEFLASIRTSIIATDKATLARLAIARSLHALIPQEKLKLPNNIDWGTAIEGVHLFKDDMDLWASLICSSVDFVVEDYKNFAQLVETHWHLGAMLLREDYDDVKGNPEDLILRIMSLLPISSGTMPQAPPIDYKGALKIKFGLNSSKHPSGEEVTFIPNAPGTSPHMAILGKTRSGKSRTGLDIIANILNNSNLPCIFIDPKGEFVKNGNLVTKSEWENQDLRRYIPNVEPIDIPRNPIGLDFLNTTTTGGRHELPQLAVGFKDSFMKCLRAKGDIALDTLREAVLDLLVESGREISLQEIEDKYLELCEVRDQKPGGIAAKLSEINSLQLFQPHISPREFFGRSWVLSFGSCSDEPKKLSIFLVLDALNNYLMSLPDAPVDNDGYRSLRHLLVIDEAREILSYRHGALSSLIRRSASKGGITILLSQGPDDFDQEEDDFLQQMGTVGVFALSSSGLKSLTGAFGKKMKSEDFSDKNLPPGVALVKLPGQNPLKIKAW